MKTHGNCANRRPLSQLLQHPASNDKMCCCVRYGDNVGFHLAAKACKEWEPIALSGEPT